MLPPWVSVEIVPTWSLESRALFTLSRLCLCLLLFYLVVACLPYRGLVTHQTPDAKCRTRRERDRDCHCDRLHPWRCRSRRRCVAPGFLKTSPSGRVAYNINSIVCCMHSLCIVTVIIHRLDIVHMICIHCLACTCT